jgi:isopenicillin N synthase-like dioxygenase
MSTTALPVLDLRRLTSDRSAFLAQLRQAARTFGFFYLSGHDIDQRLAQNILDQSRRFFARPEADKRSIDMIKSPHFRGYTRAGRELTRGLPDWREQVDFDAERDAVPSAAGQPAWLRLTGRNQWPAVQPELRPAVQQWQSACHGVTLRLLRAFALALGQAENVFDDSFARSPTQRLKIIHYPARDQVASEQGVGAHKDSSFLTLLLQDGNKGLQVQSTSGWIEGEPIAGTLIVNIGEAMELASNGYFKANVHRVVSPPPGVDRYSVAYFPGARLDARVPLLTLSSELAAEASGPETDPNNPLFFEAGNNLLKVRLRSHPDVAQRHFADVLAEQGLTIPQTASAY